MPYISPLPPGTTPKYSKRFSTSNGQPTLGELANLSLASEEDKESNLWGAVSDYLSGKDHHKSYNKILSKGSTPSSIDPQVKNYKKGSALDTYTEVMMPLMGSVKRTKPNAPHSEIGEFINGKMGKGAVGNFFKNNGVAPVFNQMMGWKANTLTFTSSINQIREATAAEAAKKAALGTAIAAGGYYVGKKLMDKMGEKPKRGYTYKEDFVEVPEITKTKITDQRGNFDTKRMDRRMAEDMAKAEPRNMEGEFWKARGEVDDVMGRMRQDMSGDFSASKSNVMKGSTPPKPQFLDRASDAVSKYVKMRPAARVGGFLARPAVAIAMELAGLATEYYQNKEDYDYWLGVGEEPRTSTPRQWELRKEANSMAQEAIMKAHNKEKKAKG